MTELMIVIPTRERPHQLAPMMEAFRATSRADTKVFFLVDGKDSCPAYEEAWQRLEVQYGSRFHLVLCADRRRLVGTLNFAVNLIRYNNAYAIGYMGDDHRPVTENWDGLYLEALRSLRTGMVYGDDGHQGEGLPTQIAMTADIPQALGYMVPPAIQHMYCDNYWLDLGRGAQCITYLPEVKVTHLHPAIHPAGKWDSSYADSNSEGSYARDAAAYAGFVDSGALGADIQKIRALRATSIHGGDQ